jgi:hypothetical protein
VARHVSVQLVDDIDGGPAAETVDFGLDGVRYTIDLSADNAARLRSTLAPYLRRARTRQPSAGGGGDRQRRRAAADSTALIRDLAERARSQRRAERDGAPEPEHSGTEQIGTEQTGPAAAEETVPPAAPEPPTPEPKPATPPPVAPVFQPPQH